MTLIELMLAVSIAATLTALAGPEVSRTLQRARLSADARTLLSTLENARSTARSLMVPVTVRIDGTALETACALTGSRRVELGRSVQRMDFDPPAETLVFNARGGVDALAPVNLEVRTTGNETWSYVVYPAIGTVRKR